MVQVVEAVQTPVPPKGKEINKRKRKSDLKYPIVNKSATVLFCLPFHLTRKATLGWPICFFIVLSLPSLVILSTKKNNFFNSVQWYTYSILWNDCCWTLEPKINPFKMFKQNCNFVP
jgi:hypothetical protein